MSKHSSSGNGLSPKITLLDTLIPIGYTVLALAFNVIVFGDDALSGSNQLILISGAIVAGIVAYFKGYTWESILGGILRSIQAAMPSMLILLLIGALSGAWMISGIVPTMIYYGLKVLHPSIFLLAACVTCSIVSVATGSSWTTAATVGLALVGIGKAMGLPEGMVAGAILSGAYFGDKLSPLSDTTNLAAAMAEVDLFEHIKYMLYTTVPSITIALILFGILGINYGSDFTGESIPAILKAIDGSFNIHLGLLLVPLLVFFLIVKKVPAIPVILFATVLGAIVAIVFQSHLVLKVGQGDYPLYSGIMKALYGEVKFGLPNEAMDDLLKGKGMEGMLGTVWLIICAMCFGGVMEGTGMLAVITSEIMKGVKSFAGLIGATSATCILFNGIASDQYLAILVPGRMYKKAFAERKVSGENLSRTLEDTGTVTSVLVPWNTCGAFHSKLFGIETLTYLPYCFFNLISPLMTLTFAFFGWKIKRLPTANEDNV